MAGKHTAFRSAAALKHPAADGKPAGTAILVGTFFYFKSDGSIGHVYIGLR
jgi:hypothetical protein